MAVQRAVIAGEAGAVRVHVPGVCHWRCRPDKVTQHDAAMTERQGALIEALRERLEAIGS